MYSVGLLVWRSLLLQAGKHGSLHCVFRPSTQHRAMGAAGHTQHAVLQGPRRVTSAALPWHWMRDCTDQAVAANTAWAPEGGLCLDLWKTSLSGSAMPTGRVSSSDNVHP